MRALQPGRRPTVVMVVAAAVAVLFGLLPAIASAAGPGQLDPTFGSRWHRHHRCGDHDQPPVARTKDRDDLLPGRPTSRAPTVGEQAPSGILRYAPDGALDPTWHGGAPVPPDTLGNPRVGLTVDTSDRLIAWVGSEIRRFGSTGSLDTGFSGDGLVDLLTSVGGGGTMEIVDVEPLPAGKLAVIAGRRRPGRFPSILVARLTAAGALDPSFSGDGRIDLPARDDAPAGIVDNPLDVRIDGDQNVVLLAEGEPSTYYVVELTPSGALRTAFSGDGVAELTSPATALAIDSSGRPIGIISDGPGHLLMSRLTTTGSPDAAYNGPDGYVDVAVPAVVGVYEVEVGADIAYVATQTASTGRPAVLAVKLGIPAVDASFAPASGLGAGALLLPSDLGTNSLPSLSRLPSGSLRAGARTSDQTTEIMQILPSGSLDPAFSDDGRAPVGVLQHHLGRPVDQVTLADGSILTASQTLAGAGDQALIDWTLADGDPNPAFGAGGQVVIDPLVAGEQVRPEAVLGLPDGRVAVLYLRLQPGSDLPSQLALYLSDGTPDLSFGEDGVIDVGIGPGFPTRARELTLGGSGGSVALFVAGPAYSPSPPDPDLFVQRVTLDGDIDLAYGAADGSDDGWAGVQLPLPGRRPGANPARRRRPGRLRDLGRGSRHRRTR